MPIPFLAAAGRAIMGCVRGGGSKAATAPKSPPPGGPRGPNELAGQGPKNAGKSSPMDMIGNVANVAMLGTMIPGLMPGGGEKPKGPEGAEGAGGKPKSHYEPVLS